MCHQDRPCQSSVGMLCRTVFPCNQERIWVRNFHRELNRISRTLAIQPRWNLPRLFPCLFGNRPICALIPCLAKKAKRGWAWLRRTNADTAPRKVCRCLPMNSFLECVRWRGGWCPRLQTFFSLPFESKGNRLHSSVCKCRWKHSVCNEWDVVLVLQPGYGIQALYCHR